MTGEATADAIKATGITITAVIAMETMETMAIMIAGHDHPTNNLGVPSTTESGPVGMVRSAPVVT